MTTDRQDGLPQATIWRRLLYVLAGAAVYFALARASLLLAIPGSNVSPVWPPSGLALALLILGGIRLWPAITLGAMSANLTSFVADPGLSAQVVLASGLISIGNTLEAVVAAALMRRFLNAPCQLTVLPDAYRFVAIALGAGAISATVGVSTLVGLSIVPSELMRVIWPTWWLGDVCGMLVLVPCVLGWTQPCHRGRLTPRLGLESALALLASVGLAWLVFGLETHFGGLGRLALALVFPLLALITYRLGLRGSSMATLAIVVTAIVAALSGRGLVPFSALNDALIQFDIIIALIALVSLLLAVDLTERRMSRQAPVIKSSLVAPWGALFAGCALTILAWHFIQQDSEERGRLSFGVQSKEVVARLADRMHDYQQMLRGAAGLFISSNDVTRAEWRQYVASLHLDDALPGVQGLGYAVRLTPAQIPAHEAQVRQEGFPDYRVHPSTAREEYTAIIYLEPFDARNQRAFGYDMFSQRVRRAAMQVARDTGEPASSGKVILLQENDRDVQNGFLMYLPVYRDSQVPDTLQARREQLVGYVYAAFRVGDLVDGTFITGLRDIGLEIFDGESMSEAAAMYASTDGLERGGVSHAQTVDIGQHAWTIRTVALPGFWSGIDQAKSQLVLVFGIMLVAALFGLIRNLAVTEQGALLLARRMTDTAQAAEARHSSLARSSGEAIVIADSDGRIVEWNPACERLFGRAMEAGHGDALAQLLVPDDRPALRAAIARARQGVREGGETLFVDASGPGDAVVPVSVSISAWGEADRRMVGAIFRDVREQRRNEEFVRGVFDEGPDGMLIVDEQARIVRANHRASEMFGYRLEALHGMHLSQLLPEDTRERHMRHFDHFARSGSRRPMGADMAIYAQHAGGFRFPVDVALNILNLPEERRFVATIVDITQRKADEALLRATLALQSAILASANSSIIATDPAGTIVSFNAAAERMLGYQAEELVGHHTPELIHDRDEVARRARELSLELKRTIEPGFEVFVAKARAGAVEEHEWTYLRKDGGRIPVLLSVTAIRDSDGLLTGFLGIATDISERKQQEKALREALQEKETLLREVYHRVKNNLQVVGSLFNLQLRSLPEGTARAALADSAARVRSMALVHEKLYQSDTLSSLDLSDYVADLSTQLASLSGADERGIRIETRVEPMFIGLERAVPLGLLINEIVTNSIKHAFTDRDGGRIEIRIRREEGEGVLEIQDDGRGFPDLEQNAARQSLGLRLASTLAKQLDGCLQRENRPGAYSQVRFALEEPTQAKR